MIQSSINQLLQSAAIFGRLAPGYESRVEARQAKKQIAAVESQLAQTSPSEEGTVGANIQQELLEERAKHSESLFKAKPSQETYRQYLWNRASTGKEPIMRIQATPEEIAQERYELEQQKAQAALQAEQNRVRNSKRSFMRDYLSKQETSLGGTVGDLPLNMQKQIASQYSKSERRKLMNSMKGDTDGNDK